MFPRPFERSYAAALTVAILAIAPYILVTTAYFFYDKQLTADLNANRIAVEIVESLATAGYAFGALLGGDLIARIMQRRLFFVCEALFIAGAVVAGSAHGIAQYGAGVTLMGFATGLLLVVALPPVVQRFPPRRMRTTSAVVNIGFFGAVTLGPIAGGAAASVHAWRWYYAVLAALGLFALLLAALTLPKTPPKKPDMPFDRAALLLAVFATALPFWASGELIGHSFDSVLFAAPLAVGMVAFIALLVVEYRSKNPLSPVRPMAKAVPVAGVLIAMFGGAALVTLMELLEELYLVTLHAKPLAAGLLFWPEVAGTLISAVLLGALIRSRLLHLLPFAGMVVLIGAGALLLFMPPHGSAPLTLAAAGLLGIGAGATVAPGLWLAGFSLPSQLVGRTFALVELVRSEADFVVAPVILQAAVVVSGGTMLRIGGFREAVWFTIGLAAFTLLVCAAIYTFNRVALPRPDLELWLLGEGDEAVAVASPPLFTSPARARYSTRSSRAG